MEYNFRDIEKKWQRTWTETGAYRVPNEFSKPKYYVLDMFPYPSGSGLHVGHPLGYIATDAFARFQRMNGHNVLHTLGYDAFGLPGEHPRGSTERAIGIYRRQLGRLGLGHDQRRSVTTIDPAYYRWTQWIFL